MLRRWPLIDNGSAGNLTLGERLRRIEKLLESQGIASVVERLDDLAVRRAETRAEVSFARATTLVFATLLVVTLGAGLLALKASTHSPRSLDSALNGSTQPLVIVGRQVDFLVAEVHVQTGDEATSSGDGAQLIAGDNASQSNLAELDTKAQAGVVVAVPRSQKPAEASGWQTPDGACATTREGTIDDLPAPAQRIAQNYMVVDFSGCQTVSLDLESVMPAAYSTDDYSTSLRFPPIAYFDRSGKVTPVDDSEPENAFQAGACENTTALLDTTQVRASAWLGAQPTSVVTPLRRTRAIFNGGSFERPQAWLADERIPESRTSASCVSQGFGIDFDRPGSVELRSRDQVIAGFLIGLASAFLISGFESGLTLLRACRRSRYLYKGDDESSATNRV